MRDAVLGLRADDRRRHFRQLDAARNGEISQQRNARRRSRSRHNVGQRPLGAVDERRARPVAADVTPEHGRTNQTTNQSMLGANSSSSSNDDVLARRL